MASVWKSNGFLWYSSSVFLRLEYSASRTITKTHLEICAALAESEDRQIDYDNIKFEPLPE